MDKLTTKMAYKRSTIVTHVFENYNKESRVRGQVYVLRSDMKEPTKEIEVEVRIG